MKNNETPPRGTRNTFLSFFLMISLVTVLFLFAIGFRFFDAFYSLSFMFFQKLKQLFTFSPLLPPTTPSPSSLEPSSLFMNLRSQSQPLSYSMIASEPDLEAGINDNQIEVEDSDSEHNSDSDSEYELEIGSDYELETDTKEKESTYLFPTLSEPTNDFIRQEPEQDLEIEMVQSVPPPMSISKNKTLDMAIEKTSKPSTTPKATFEEWQEPIPIDEEDIPENINGWCFIGQSKGARACAPVGKMDKCVTGELYANQMECLQLHPDDAVVPPPLL